eukprot:scaffold137060_cov50-Attheya_sp.AAC.3
MDQISELEIESSESYQMFYAYVPNLSHYIDIHDVDAGAGPRPCVSYGTGRTDSNSKYCKEGARGFPFF